MNRINQKFRKLKEFKKSAFIAFLEAGDPSIEKTEELIYAMEESGVDIIEIGIPFSDPLADGPVIQDATLRAFKIGISIKKIFDCVERVRENTEIPLLFLVYFNTIFNYGIEKFVKKCKEVGIDGLIIPDLPLEEREDILQYNKKYKVALIPMVAPTSKNRIKKVIEGCDGFVYCVSSLGVTGVRQDFHKDLDDFLNLVKDQSAIPIAVGFGISSREDIRRLSKKADGVIVGSAIVSVIGETQGECEAVKRKIIELMED